jgi:hypothetical protein
MPLFKPSSSLIRTMRCAFPLLRVRGLLRAQPQFAVALPEAERLPRIESPLCRSRAGGGRAACRIAALQGEIALVHCANGAAASRVRAQAKGVASVLSRRRCAGGSSLKVKIRADWSCRRCRKARYSGRRTERPPGLEDSLPEGG